MRRSSQRGAVLVEFALVLPLFVMLVLGIISAGRLYDVDMHLSHAAREGARYGATMPRTQSFTSGTWASNVQDLVVQKADGQVTAAQVCVALVTGVVPVAVSSAHTTAGGTSPCFDDSAAGDAARRVQVRATRTVTFDAMVLSYDQVLTAQATSRHEVVG